LGREIGYIIKGKAQLIYDGKTYDLEAGDSVSFSAGASHSIENIGDTEMEAVWVVTPAQRFIDK
jgi:quercetin dioxygenase-like cupin family protein